MQISEDKIKELQKILDKKVTREMAEKLLSYFELLNTIKNKNYERRKNN